MRKNVVDIDMYKNEPNELLLGQIAILGAGSIWLLFVSIPIGSFNYSYNYNNYNNYNNYRQPILKLRYQQLIVLWAQR